MNLTKNCKITRVLNAQAAGATDITSATLIDMAGFDSVTFLVHFGAIVTGAVTSIKVQQGQASDGSDLADLAGSGVTVADTDDNKVVVVEIERPRERYVKLIISRATQNATVDSATAIQCCARTYPVTQDTTVKTPNFLLSPAEGTA